MDVVGSEPRMLANGQLPQLSGCEGYLKVPQRDASVTARLNPRVVSGVNGRY